MVLIERSKAYFTELNVTKVFALLIIIIAFFGFFRAIKYSSAAMNYYFVNNVLSEWKDSGSVSNQDDYNDVLQAIDKSQRLHPLNPLYIEIDAQVLEWGIIAGIESKTALNEAKELYLAASRKRPAWPVTWANLALIKSRLNEFDDELLFYLDNAHRHGPHTAEIHLMFSKLGMALYTDNNPFFLKIEDRVKLKLMMAIKSSRVRPDIMDFLRRTNNVRTVCRWFDDDHETLRQNYLNCKLV